MRRTLQVILPLFLCSCSSVEGRSGNEYKASAYTMAGCQEKLDEMAGGKNVTMTEHVSQGGISALNLGLVPAVVCTGRAEKRLPHIDEVVGTDVDNKGEKAVVVFVPGQDNKPFGIKCDQSNFVNTTPPWPDGPAIYKKYCVAKR